MSAMVRQVKWIGAGVGSSWLLLAAAVDRRHRRHDCRGCCVSKCRRRQGGARFRASASRSSAARRSSAAAQRSWRRKSECAVKLIAADNSHTIHVRLRARPAFPQKFCLWGQGEVGFFEAKSPHAGIRVADRTLRFVHFCGRRFAAGGHSSRPPGRIGARALAVCVLKDFLSAFRQPVRGAMPGCTMAALRLCRTFSVSSFIPRTTRIRAIPKVGGTLFPDKLGCGLHSCRSCGNSRPVHAN